MANINGDALKHPVLRGLRDALLGNLLLCYLYIVFRHDKLIISVAVFVGISMFIVAPIFYLFGNKVGQKKFKRITSIIVSIVLVLSVLILCAMWVLGYFHPYRR